MHIVPHAASTSKTATVIDRSHACGMGFLTVADSDGQRYCLRDIACVFAHVHAGDTLTLELVDYPADLGGRQWVWGITQAHEIRC